jgi:hypothetical protein
MGEGTPKQNSFHVTLINPSPTQKVKIGTIGYDQNRIMVKLPFGPTCTGITAFELWSKAYEINCDDVKVSCITKEKDKE